MAPSVFWPAPKVTSAVIRLTVDPAQRAAIGDLRYFHDFTRAIFLHRRKFLRANVVAAMKRFLNKEEVDRLLDEMEFAPDTRTEQLDVTTLVEFAKRARRAAPNWSLNG
jgi:16S rRNA (adenine1518-N6/adenine1519-N6)-dimethyltransferase